MNYIIGPVINFRFPAHDLLLSAGSRWSAYSEHCRAEDCSLRGPHFGINLLVFLDNNFPDVNVWCQWTERCKEKKQTEISMTKETYVNLS
jgi:hypothetical protein